MHVPSSSLPSRPARRVGLASAALAVALAVPGAPAQAATPSAPVDPGTAHTSAAWEARHLPVEAPSRAGLTGAAGVPAYVRGARVHGLDVSAHQGRVAWSSWSRTGKRFVWIKATEGQTWRSPMYSFQYLGATANGFYHGAYHFARPKSSSGTAQARAFVANGGRWRADGATLPGALDMEMPPSGDLCYGKSPRQLVSWMKGFTREYRRLTGREAIIYTTNYWWRECTNNSKAFSGTNKLWLARYSSTPGAVPGGWARPAVWQHSEIRGMDHNVWFGSKRSLQQWAGKRRG